MRNILLTLARAALRRIMQDRIPAPTDDEVREAGQIMFGMNKTERGWLWAVKFGDAKIWGEAIDEDRAHRDGFDAVMRAQNYTVQ